MPSNYTGNGGATQSPSPTPAAGSPPVGSLPVDGDPDNAASIAQALKVALDFITFGQSPFANANAWNQKLRRYKDALLHDRFVVDHFGFPDGALLQWSEDFTPSTPWGTAGAGTTNVARWNVVNTGSGTATYSEPPSFAYAVPPLPSSMNGFSTNNTSRQFVGVLDSGGSGGVEVSLHHDYVTSSFADDTLLWADVDFTPFTVTDVSWVVGFTNYGQAIGAINDGAFFFKPDTPGTNWKAVVVKGGTATSVDTGVLAVARTNHDFRIAMVGKNSDDGGNGRVLFWIDGVEKTSGGITTNMPVNQGWQAAPIFGGFGNGTPIASPVCLCNGVRYGQITRVSTP